MRNSDDFFQDFKHTKNFRCFMRLKFFIIYLHVKVLLERDLGKRTISASSWDISRSIT